MMGNLEGAQKKQKATGGVRPWQKNLLLEFPGSQTRRGTDSQQAHPIDLLADKFSVFIHMARLLSGLTMIGVYHRES
jgi:hypothetical protein